MCQADTICPQAQKCNYVIKPGRAVVVQNFQLKCNTILPVYNFVLHVVYAGSLIKANGNNTTKSEGQQVGIALGVVLGVVVLGVVVLVVIIVALCLHKRRHTK